MLEPVFQKVFEPFLRVSVRGRVIQLIEVAGVVGKFLLNILRGFLVDLIAFEFEQRGNAR